MCGDSQPHVAGIPSQDPKHRHRTTLVMHPARSSPTSPITLATWIVCGLLGLAVIIVHKQEPSKNDGRRNREHKASSILTILAILAITGSTISCNFSCSPSHPSVGTLANRCHRISSATVPVPENQYSISAHRADIMLYAHLSEHRLDRLQSME
jgi:hypothetical protein